MQEAIFAKLNKIILKPYELVITLTAEIVLSVKSIY